MSPETLRPKYEANQNIIMLQGREYSVTLAGSVTEETHTQSFGYGGMYERDVKYRTLTGGGQVYREGAQVLLFDIKPIGGDMSLRDSHTPSLDGRWYTDEAIDPIALADAIGERLLDMAEIAMPVAEFEERRYIDGLFKDSNAPAFTVDDDLFRLNLAAFDNGLLDYLQSKGIVTEDDGQIRMPALP